MYGRDKHEAVQRMQDYAQANICGRITMKELADAAGYSTWHAAKLFREICGIPPFQYLRQLRLTKAALVLRDEDRQIIDVALDFVFDSHEGFTRAFSREFGISPKGYSLNKPPIQLFMPQGALKRYKENNKGERNMETQRIKTVFVQVVERPARKLLLKRGIGATHYFSYCEEVGCDVWPVLCSVKEALYEPVGLWLPRHMIPVGTSEYVQGVELPEDYGKAPPDGYELISLPPCTMMIFQGEPYEDEYYGEEIGALWDHISHFDPTVYGYARDPEAAPRFQLAPMGYRGYIEARPVKRLTHGLA